MQAAAKPKTLCCYVCGREFGTTSLSIHLKNCRGKFENEQSKKQARDRIAMPSAPEQLAQILNGDLDESLIQTYNQKAVQTHKYQVLPKCQFCDRTFNEESLKAHEKGCNKKSNQPIQQTKAGQLAQAFKKPRTLTCCICGRDFGLTSLRIHYPQCYLKFISDEQLKLQAQRRQPPQFSAEELEMINTKDTWTLEEIEGFNRKASSNYRDKAMVQCQNCGRKFLEQSYQKHKKNCALINGKKQPHQAKPTSMPSQLRSTSSEFKKPRTLQCCVCGREFGLTSLRIHYPQCIEKFMNEQMKKPKGERKQSPTFSEEQLQMINNKQDWTLEEIQAFNNHANTNYRNNAMVECLNCGRKFIEASYLKHKKNCQLINGDKISASLNKERSEDGFRPGSPEFKKPRTLTCCVCGRDFGLTSLKIHYPQCLQKFLAEENIKPKESRKEPPTFSQEQLAMVNTKDQWTFQEIEAFNRDSNSNYRNYSMVECTNCGRKFIQQSYLKHKKNCALINGKKQGVQSASKLSLEDNSCPTKKPRVLMCYICGRQFGLTSLNIHLPQCVQKFENLESKKQHQARRPLPIFPKDQLANFDIAQASGWEIEKIQQYNKIAQDVYRSQSLCSCPICGRKFFQESLPKHLKFCQKEKQKKEEAAIKKTNSSKSLNRSNSLNKFPNQNQKNSDIELNLKHANEKIQEVLDSQVSIGSTPEKQMGNEKQIGRKEQANQSNNNDLIEGIIQTDENLQETLAKKTLGDDLLSNQGKQNSVDQELVGTEKKQPLEFPSESQKDQINVSQNSTSKTTQKENSLEKQIPSSNSKKLIKGFAAPRKKQELIQANMKECKVCTRKFTDDKISKHQTLCFQNKQRQKKSQKSIVFQQGKITEPEQQDKQKINERSILSPEQKIRLKKGFAAPRQKQAESQAQMTECRGCKRKFAPDRVEKHEGVCKLAQDKIRQPFVAGSYKKIDQIIQDQKISIKRVPCPKCLRKFTQDRLEKHSEICKAVSANSQSQKIPSVQKKQASNSKVEFQKQAFQNVNLQKCQKCGRNFTCQRIQKHQQICKGINQKKISPSLTNPFKKQKSIQEVQISAQNLDNMDSKPEQIDDRVPCQKCQRKFAKDRIQKHISICKAIAPLSDIESRPKITPKLELAPLKEKPSLKLEPKTPKLQQKLTSTIGQDQYIENELQACIKCSRKFIKERLQKHLQVCKGEKRMRPEADRPIKNATQMKRQKKLGEEQIRKTKNQFFHMMKDLKCKKIKQEQIEKQLDQELLAIQATHKVSRKQNVNRSNSDRKKMKEVNKSINLPKI